MEGSTVLYCSRSSAHQLVSMFLPNSPIPHSTLSLSSSAPSLTSPLHATPFRAQL